MEVCIVGFFDLLRDGFAEPGTTARLNGELGAKPSPPNPVKVSSQIGPGSAVVTHTQIGKIGGRFT